MKIVCIQSTTYDYLTSTIIEGLQELGHSVIASENSNGARKSSNSEIIDGANNADLIIIFSNVNVRHELINNVNNPNKIFVDGSDHQFFSVPRHIRFKAIFKRELNRAWINQNNEPVFALPFAAERRYFAGKSSGRDLDLSFVAGLASNTVRYSVFYRLLRKSNPNFYVGSTDESAYKHLRIKGGPTETPVFRDILFRSKVSVNVVGAGYDCARYWEILASGAMLLTQELEIEMPFPFVSGDTCIIFKTMDDLDEKIDLLFSSPGLIQTVAERGYQHLLKHHTTRARAQYLLDSVFFAQDDVFCDSFYVCKNSKIRGKLISFFRR